jgi:hypothetical protein
MTLSNMNIKDYFFDVRETPVQLLNGEVVSDYKAIIKQDSHSHQVISVVKDTYKLVRNRELIEPFLDEIQNLGNRWYIDSSHSFVQPNRMRLQITFPDVYVSDTESKIPLSVYLHNSYDQSEGIRMFWGAIRAICTNGMILGDVLGKYYARHTKGFQPELIVRQFDSITSRIGGIQERIHQLDEIPTDAKILQEVQKVLGKRRYEEILQTDVVPDVSQWELYNKLTYHISHNVDKPQRAAMQLKTSHIFAL